MKKANAIILGSVVIIMSLGALFIINRHKIEKSNFSRNWLSKKISKLKEIDTFNNIQSVEYYNKDLYLNNLTKIISLDTSGRPIKTYNFDQQDIAWTHLIIGFNVDSSGISIQDNRARAISKIDFNNKLLYSKKITEPIYRACFLKDDRYIIKTGSFKDHYANELFSIYDVKSGSEQLNDSLMPKFNTGGIATDGFFVKAENKILHIYYYMSDVIVFDNNGNHVTTFKTIDAENKSPYIITTPEGHAPGPKVQAKHSAGFVEGDILYLCSNVSSKDMTDDQFDNNVIIDTYDLAKGGYKGSFLLPKTDKRLVNSIIVQKNAIYAIQGSNLLTFYSIIGNEKLAYSSK